MFLKIVTCRKKARCTYNGQTSLLFHVNKQREKDVGAYGTLGHETNKSVYAEDIKVKTKCNI